jgi:hypothetical protein
MQAPHPPSYTWPWITCVEHIFGVVHGLGVNIGWVLWDGHDRMSA